MEIIKLAITLIYIEKYPISNIYYIYKQREYTPMGKTKIPVIDVIGAWRKTKLGTHSARGRKRMPRLAPTNDLVRPR